MLNRYLPIAVILLLTGAVVAPVAAPTAFAQTPSPSRPTYQDDLFAPIARAHELLDLKDTSLSAGSREIRIRGDLLMACCGPTPMLRLTQDSKGTRGELVLFRILILRPGNPAPRVDERCVPYRDQLVVCARPWPLKAGEWTRVASTLEELGAWSISEPCEVSGPGVSDSGGLYMQRLVGTAFSAYRCNAPSYRTGSHEGQRANAIHQYLWSLAGTIPNERDAVVK
jgi:hypothetical protein